MTIKTIDGILASLQMIDHPATLLELAWVMDHYEPRERFVAMLERAPIDARSRELIESMLARARAELCTEGQRGGRNPETGLRFEVSNVKTIGLLKGPDTATLLVATAFANFVADTDEHHAPIMVVEVQDRADEKKPVRAILRLWCMLESLMVLAGTSPRASCESGGTYFQMTRTDNKIDITVEGDEVQYEIAVDPLDVFELAALLTAQVRRAMPFEARDHLPWLIDRVFVPLHNSPDAPNQEETSRD